MNAIAKHIATKKVAKHMTRDAAKAVWLALKADGFRAEGLTLVKLDGATEHRFAFSHYGEHKMTISHTVNQHEEVAS